MYRVKPPNWKLNLAMLWISQMMILSGYQAIGPFVPLYMKQGLNVTSEHDLAVYVAMFQIFGTLAYCIFNPIWGRLSDRYGAKLMLLRGTFVTAFIFPLMGYVKTPEMFIFLRFLTAACAGTTAISNMMIVRNTPNEHQGFALGLLATAIWGGGMLGNVICGMIIKYYGYVFSLWMCGLMYFLAGGAVIFTRDEAVVYSSPPKSSGSSFNWKNIFPTLSTSVWIMLSLFVVIGFIRYYEIPYIAIKIEEITGTENAAYWTGIVSAFICLGAVISGAWTGYLSDHYPAKLLLYPIFILSAAGLFMQGGSDNLWSFGIGRTVLYLAAGGLPSVIQKYLALVTPQRKRGSAFGLASTFNGIGIMAASAISGFTFSFTGCKGTFYIAAGLFLISLPVFVIGIDRALRNSVQSDQQEC